MRLAAMRCLRPVWFIAPEPQRAKDKKISGFSGHAESIMNLQCSVDDFLHPPPVGVPIPYNWTPPMSIKKTNVRFFY
jgi:hypothetical protein